MKQQQNRAAIRKVLEKNNIAIIEGEEGLRSRPLREQVFTSDKVEKIVGWAVGHHLVNSEQKGQEVRMDGTKLMLPATAIDHGIRMLNRIQPLATKVPTLALLCACVCGGACAVCAVVRACAGLV
jgi:hypothetical protein